MALSDKKYDTIHTKTGGDKDKLKDEFDAGYLTKISDIPDKEPALAALVYQMGLMQEELDYLRTEISSNKDKATFPGLGTSSSTALAGDTTTISTAQASAITANTAKTTFPGLGTSRTTALAGDTTTISTAQASAITANTAKISQGLNTANTTMQFDVTQSKGSYFLTITVVAGTGKAAITKTVTLTLV